MEKRSRWEAALFYVAWIGIVAGLCMPLVWARIVIFPAIFLKVLFFQTIVGITFPAYLALAWLNPKYRPRFHILAISVGIWILAQGISTIGATDRSLAFWGDQNRMDGYFTQLHYAAWLVMTASLVLNADGWRHLLRAQIFIGVVIALSALLQIPFPQLIGSSIDEGARVFGLLGNPIFLAAYLLMNFFWILYLWPGSTLRWRLFFAVAAVLFLGAVIMGGSRGPLLGLFVGLFATAVTYALAVNNRRFAYLFFGVLTLSLVAYLCIRWWAIPSASWEQFWDSNPSLNRLFSWKEHSRLPTWSLAWKGFLEHPILGWGPVNFEVLFRLLYSPEMICREVQDKAHNIFLEVLCQTGLLGFIAFIGLWAAISVTVVKARNRLHPLSFSSLVGLGIGHLCEAFFSFETPASSLTLALFMALLLSHGWKKQERITSNFVSFRLHHLLGWAALQAGLLAVVLTGSILPFYASHLIKKAATAYRQKNYNDTFILAQRAAQISTPYRNDQIMLLTHSLKHIAYTKKRELLSWEYHSQAISLFQIVAESHSQKHPHSLLRLRIAETLSVLGQLIPHLQKKSEKEFMATVSSNDQYQPSLIAYGQHLAKSGRKDTAEPYFRKALQLNQNAGLARWKLGKFLWVHLRQSQQGAALMASSQDENLICRYHLHSPLEMQQLAQAYTVIQQPQKIPALAANAQALSGWNMKTYLGVAKYLERAGFLKERDQFLQWAAKQDKSIWLEVKNVLAGKARLESKNN